MSEVAKLIADMVRAGVDPELIGRTAETIAGVSQPPTSRTARQERNARYYRRKASEKRLNQDVSDVSDADVLSPKEIPPTPPKEITPIPVSEPIGSSTKSAREFERFWALYPNKVGKRDAEKAFAKARSRASFEAIMDGLGRYVAKIDDRPWCNPTTFLNQDRWEDQPAASPSRAATGPPQDDFNSILDGYINGSIFDVHSQRDRSVRTGHSGPDRGSAQGVVQLHALPSRR